MFTRALSFAAVVASVACGGHLDTDPNPDGGDSCPTNPTTCSQEGATCSRQVNECGHPEDETCTCSNGSWACPVSACPKETCPINPEQGEACFSTGMSCPSNIVPECTDVSVTCTCDGNQFQCPIPPCPPPLLCPPPDQVVAGQGCNVPANESCINGGGDSCFCSGAWECEGADGGVAEAGSN
jgi:hypothetical protein